MLFSFDWQEAFQFRPGQRVELKSQPGVFDTVANYDPMMVPPVWLVNDPIPRYPEELRLVYRPFISTGRLNRQRQLKIRHPGHKPHNRVSAKDPATF